MIANSFWGILTILSYGSYRFGVGFYIERGKRTCPFSKVPPTSTALAFSSSL
jgi:hypothetical protein